MKKIFLPLVALALVACGSTQTSPRMQPVVPVSSSESPDAPIVYFTSEISPEGLLNIYNALGCKPEGKVGVKISTGESSKSHYLRPELIAPLVKAVNGTLIECNTAYGGSRMKTEDHRKAIAERGFEAVAPVDIMDEDGDIRIPVLDKKHIQYDIVGKNIRNYNFVINLAHFKGHAMGGFGGVLKNQSIGFASTAGKFYIHSAGESQDHWITAEQDAFLESMAAAAQAVHDYFGQGERILYINVANNLSVDCDCDSHPADPEMNDIGILASLDPVALDQACVDLVFHYPSKEGDDAAALIERINSRHGIHILEQAEKIGLGSREYQLVSIDEEGEK